MNKIVLIAGGTSAVSLAVGGAAGYFYARREFNKKVEPLITEQVDKTKKHYSILLEEARKGKPESIMDIPISNEEELELELEAEDPPATADVASPAVDSFIRSQANKAMIDYRGMSDKPQPDAPVATENVFDQPANKARPLPPRDPVTKRFVPRERQSPADEEPKTITLEQFVENEDGHQQVSLMYFANEKTLLDPMTKETVDLDEVGAENLDTFPVVDAGVTCEIYIRNGGLQQDYDITKTEDDLTDWLGLGDGIGNHVADSKSNDQSQWV